MEINYYSGQEFRVWVVDHFVLVEHCEMWRHHQGLLFAYASDNYCCYNKYCVDCQMKQ